MDCPKFVFVTLLGSPYFHITHQSREEQGEMCTYVPICEQ